MRCAGLTRAGGVVRVSCRLSSMLLCTPRSSRSSDDPGYLLVSYMPLAAARRAEQLASLVRPVRRTLCAAILASRCAHLHR